MNSPSSSRLLQVTNFDKCRCTLLKLNSSKRSVSKFKKREEISSSLAYFLYKTWYQAFWLRSRAVTEKKCTKSVMQVQNCCFGYWTYCFFDVLVAVAVVCLTRWGIFYGRWRCFWLALVLIPGFKPFTKRAKIEISLGLSLNHKGYLSSSFWKKNVKNSYLVLIKIIIIIIS